MGQSINPSGDHVLDCDLNRFVVIVFVGAVKYFAVNGTSFIAYHDAGAVSGDRTVTFLDNFVLYASRQFFNTFFCLVCSHEFFTGFFVGSKGYGQRFFTESVNFLLYRFQVKECFAFGCGNESAQEVTQADCLGAVVTEELVVEALVHLCADLLANLYTSIVGSFLFAFT